MNLGKFWHFEWAGPYSIFLRMLTLMVLVTTVSRLGLLIWQWPRVADSGPLLPILIQGMRADLVLVGLFAAFPILISPLLLTKWTVRFWWRFSLVWAMVCVLLVLFLELATPNFLMQYDMRPNFIFVEYLKYPKEVLSTLWNGFRFGLIIVLLLSAFGSVAVLQLLRRKLPVGNPWSYTKTLLVWPFVLLVSLLMARSTLQHRPVNPAKFAITHDAMVNSLVINSLYSVLFAVYSMKNEDKSSEIYGRMTMAEAWAEIKTEPWLAQLVYPYSDAPTYHRQIPSIHRAQPLNLVIILEESFGATFVQSLGGMPDTPELERLKAEGWWFENLYATGTRSVRGIEAVVSGQLPTPAQSVVKLAGAQRDYYTLASSFARQGWNTEFIYGGEAHFDNMRNFFTGNGFRSIIEQQDFLNPIFTASWGVSDEDLFNMAHERLLDANRTGKPFFKLVFTSSNHEPFEYPDGRIKQVGVNKQNVDNAVRYADYALGRFFDRAKKSAYWENTVFLVVADHDNRVYGNSLVPINKFHIPGLILGSSIKPKKIEIVASQVDLAPTLLSLIGLSTEHPMVGRDLSVDQSGSGRAMMQFDNYFALLEGSKVTILQPNNSPLQGQYNSENGQLSFESEKVPMAQVRRTLAYASLPSLMYKNHLYSATPPKAAKQ